jgi:hypothetical protein
MNHRELILSRAGAKTRSTFLELPEELQDELIEGLDNGSLTLREASDKCKAAGRALSYEAISNYYRAVRRERRMYDIANDLRRVVEDQAGGDTAKLTAAAVNLLLSRVVQGLADGDIGVKDLDAARMMALLPAPTPASPAAEASSAAGNAPLDKKSPGELTEKVKDIYGL